MFLTWAGSATAQASSANDNFKDKLLALGTGPAGGAFRPIGESVCDGVNEERRQSSVRCVPVGTAGTAFNLQAVEDGTLQVGLAQEDLLARKYLAARQGQASRLRVIAVLHTSPIAIVVHKSAGIRDLTQIAGKVVNLGNRGSGQFVITASILEALGLRTADLRGVTYAATSEFETLFCERKVDVVVEAVAHPSPLFEKLLACDGELLDVPPAVIARMQATNAFLSEMEIPAGTYAGMPRAVRTLGMHNVLFTSAAVDAEAIFRFTRSLSAKLDALRLANPLLASAPAIGSGTFKQSAVPLHAGARRALAAGPP